MKVQKSGAVFNKEKLLWFNKEYIKRMSKEDLEHKIFRKLSAKYTIEKDFLEKITPTITERINTFGELEKYVAEGEFDYFFNSPKPEKEMLIWKKDTDFEIPKNNLLKVLGLIKKISDSDFNQNFIQSTLMPVASESGKGSMLWPLRVALSGREKSPDPFTLLTILGKIESIKRIEQAISVI